MERIDDKSAYPTQAAKDCASKSTDLTTNPIPSLFLSSKQLKDCKDFKLISSSDKVLDHYGKAVSDLNELERFQKVIQEISDLLGQAGEVYTVYQFKSQMLTLLNEINLFIGDSAVHINEIIEENTQAYHKAIRDEQDLSLFKKWFSDEKEKLSTYIKNQDTLSQYPSTASDLSKTQGKLSARVNDVVNHLSNPRVLGSSFETISGQTQELNKLIGSMHNWISTQHELKGLPSPPPPAQILPPTTSSIQSGYTASVEPVHYPTLFSSPPTNTTLTCPSENGICTDKTIDTTPALNSNMYLGLVALIPVGVLLFILVYKLTRRKEESEDQQIPPPNDRSKTKFNKLKIEFDDLLTKIQRIDAQAFEDSTSELSYIVEEYEDLISKSKSNIYNTSGLKSALEELESYYGTLEQTSNLTPSRSNH
jgi:flagellar biosynthesis chaperone FliJ